MTFDDACVSMVRFLVEQLVPANLVWICRDEITGFRRQVFVHPRPSTANADFYQRLFDQGKIAGRGMAITACCFVDETAYCHLEVPPDDVAASQMMMTHGMRFNYATEDVSQGAFRGTKCKTVTGFQLRRQWCRWRGETPFLQFVPARAS